MLYRDPVFIIKKISALKTYGVRQLVLRPGRPAKECEFEGDFAEETFHLGLYLGEELIGVSSFMKVTSHLFPYPDQFQLRGMALLPTHKGKGYGMALLKEGESQLIAISSKPFLWFNARDYAIGFYEKLGYRTFGEKFNIPGVCPHIVMFKHLQQVK